MRYYKSLIAALIVAVAVLAACQKQAEVQTEVGPDGIARINLENAKKLFDQGGVVFVDTRAEIQYKEEHVKGAINVPAEAFQTRFGEVPKDKKIVTYCS